MAEPLFGLTAQDHEILRHLIQWYRTQSPILNTRNRPQIERERNSEAPQLYIARTPTDGIPSNSSNDVGSPSDDEPGSAECEIYQVLRYNNPVTVSPTAANDKTVYNIGNDSIPGDTWIIVARDAFGSWIAIVGGSFAGRGKVTARLGDGIYRVQPIKRAWIGTGSGTSLADYENTEWVNNGPTVEPCFRLPTEDDSPPPVPVGQACLFGKDAVGYWMTPWGGQKKFTITVVRAVYCNGPTITTVVKDWDHSARDNCWRESAG